MKNKKLLWLILAAAAVILVMVLVSLGNRNDVPTETTQGPAIETQEQSQTTPVPTTGPAGETTGPAGEEQTVPTDGDHDPNGTEPAATTDQTEPQADATQPTSPLAQQTEADYEKWLGAALVVCVSMEYPDFELEGVYAASSTALADKFSSDGAYILFTSGGSSMAIHAAALTEERTDRGTTDISTETIGYATFDPVDPTSVDWSALEALDVEELSDLIAQSLLVRIYSR